MYRRIIRRVHDIPYHERNNLCSCLDENDKWRELGHKLGFDDQAINTFRRQAGKNSPTNYLLAEWGIQQNGEILTLFLCLLEMNHFQAMRILKSCVPPEYHNLIEGEEGYFSGRNHSFTPVRPDGLLTRSSFVCSIDGSYEEFRQATNNWDERLLLGKGGFGKVFRGVWRHTAVAIKRLDSMMSGKDRYYNLAAIAAHQEQDSLRAELKYLTKYRHDNILPVYAYSSSGEKPCLVYQLMPKGSLEDQLQFRRNNKPLSWWRRVTIANGAARGLQYLHSFQEVVHGDIKSANILLDDNFVPKVGDFGLARNNPIKDVTYDFTKVDITTIRGTKAYLPAEVLRSSKLSFKSDTYAFGVVLCELATGRRASFYNSGNFIKLRDHCHNAADDNSLSSLKDSRAESEDEDFFEDLIQLGLKCTSLKPMMRPQMVEVLKELDIIMESRYPPPIQPSAFDPVNTTNDIEDVITYSNAPIPIVSKLRISSESET